MSVLIETSEGDLVVDLNTDSCPKSCTNFLKLCKTKYYYFAPFYNVHHDFTAQSGDPDYPLGSGGQSIWGGTFKPEIDEAESLKKGDIAMALSTDTQTAGSQFVIVLNDIVGSSLQGKVAKFGQIAEGFDTLDKINNAHCDEDHRPFRDIRIKHSYILEDPFDDPPGVEEREDSPEPTEKQLSTVRIENWNSEQDENVDEDERLKQKQSQQARSQALTLEMVGDLPFAEVKPQENVLFVCKLNPVTQDEDLKLIFSRFGEIVSCQVARDFQTGDSLGYAFIEFEQKEACERAYFKMDNVLIDDRRIHVDFSQSVSSLSDSWRQNQNKMRRQAHGSKFRSSGAASSSSSSSTKRYREDRDQSRHRSRHHHSSSASASGSSSRNHHHHRHRHHRHHNQDNHRRRSRSPPRRR